MMMIHVYIHGVFNNLSVPRRSDLQSGFRQPVLTLEESELSESFDNLIHGQPAV